MSLTLFFGLVLDIVPVSFCVKSGASDELPPASYQDHVQQHQSHPRTASLPLPSRRNPLHREFLIVCTKVPVYKVWTDFDGLLVNIELRVPWY